MRTNIPKTLTDNIKRVIITYYIILQGGRHLLPYQEDETPLRGLGYALKNLGQKRGAM